MSDKAHTLEEIVQKENQKFYSAKEEICKVIVGQKAMIETLFIALLADGHLILEGLPGLAKTLAVNTLAKVFQCDFNRVQFTPDLLPADLIGTQIYNPKEGSFSVNQGPIFTNILLADEINRAPAKVQSGLLEVMQERQVTIGTETFKTGTPFLVLATQNPIELEGTFPLPEAQTDRFMMKIKLDYPTESEEKLILQKMAKITPTEKAKAVLNVDDILNARKIIDQIYVDEKIQDYILKLVLATRAPSKFGIDADHLILYGASPRASISFVMAAKAKAFLSGRAYVTPDDIKQIGHDILRHRIRRTYEAEAEEISSDQIIDMIFTNIQMS